MDASVGVSLMYRTSLMTPLVLISIPAMAADSLNWTDITPPGLQYPAERTMGITMSDVDNDGDDDLLVATGAHVGGPTLLFLNDGMGNFTDATGGGLEEPHKVWTPLMGDYDNDGDPDLLQVCNGERCRLWENRYGESGDGVIEFYERYSGGLFATMNDMQARGGAWVDYDNDGLLDIMISTNGAIGSLGSDKLLRNTNGYLFVDATPESFFAPRKGRGVAWADFDGDGDMDLYAVGGTGCPCSWAELPEAWQDHAQNRMFRNDDGVMVDITDEVTINGLPGRGVSAADYDNDGDIDLYINNTSLTGTGGDGQTLIHGVNSLLRNDGNWVFTDVTPEGLRCQNSERSNAWLDYDNDGDLDMVMTVMWLNMPIAGLFENINEGESFVQVMDPIFMNWMDPISGVGCGISDVDDDGDLDMLLGYKYGPNQLLRNDLDNDNAWLKVKLVGTTSNRDAIGARVRVRTGSKWRMREVQAGSGYWSQHSLVQHFGLGEIDGLIQEVVIRWPSGLEQTLHDLDPNQKIVVVEGNDYGCGGGDIDGNNTVDVADLLLVISSWGECAPCTAADIDENGRVDVVDLLTVINDWGTCP